MSGHATASARSEAMSQASAVIPTPEPAWLDFVTDPGNDPAAFDRYHAFYTLGADVGRLGERFRADVRCLRLDRTVIHDRRLRAVSHGRTTDRVRRDDLNHFTVTLCLAGTMFGAGRQGFRRIRPGEIWLSDMSRPVETRIEDARLLTLAVAREVVEAVTARPADLNATILSASQSAPLAQSLLRFVARRDALSPHEAAAASGSVSDLIGDILGRPSAIDARRLERMAMARRLVEAHLDEPDLDAELIAADLHLSRSTVYRLFQDLGGVAHYIQARRLQRLKRLLSARRGESSIADIAALVGFASESHASRLFLHRYGLRPGAFRKQVRGLSGLAVDRARMGEWLEDLQ